MGGIAVSRASTASPDRPWSLIGDLPAWGEMLPTIRAVVPAAGAEADSDASIGIGSWFTVRQPGPPMAVYEVTE